MWHSKEILVHCLTLASGSLVACTFTFMLAGQDPNSTPGILRLRWKSGMEICCFVQASSQHQHHFFIFIPKFLQYFSIFRASTYSPQKNEIPPGNLGGKVGKWKSDSYVNLGFGFGNLNSDSHVDLGFWGGKVGIWGWESGAWTC